LISGDTLVLDLLERLIGGSGPSSLESLEKKGCTPAIVTGHSLGGRESKRKYRKFLSYDMPRIPGKRRLKMDAAVLSGPGSWILTEVKW